MDTFIILIVKIYQIKYFVNRLIKPQRVIKKKKKAGHMKGKSSMFQAEWRACKKVLKWLRTLSSRSRKKVKESGDVVIDRKSGLRF